MSDFPLKNSNAVFHNVTQIEQQQGGVLSDEIRLVCQWIIFAILCQAIDLFGIATNIINIICFIKQGFNDPVNISLLGLAIADLGCLITLVWTNLCYTPAFSDQDLPFDTIEFQYLTSGMPHTTFARITGWLTAVVTMERCLCVTMPLKVKQLVTPRRVSIAVVSIFIILLSSVSPVYIVNKLGMKFFPSRNKTLLGLVLTDNREDVEQVSFAINNVFIPFSAFFVVNICTFTIVFKIQKRTVWRTKITASVQADNISNRNRKVAKMVVMISCLFIACFVPSCLTFTAMVLEPEFAIDRRYKNTLIVAAGICFILESINSSVNIFIYYRMSSKYRRILRQLFCRQPDIRSRTDDS